MRLSTGMPDSQYPDYLVTDIIGNPQPMQFEGAIGAVILYLVFVGWISFGGDDDALDFFQYFGLDVFSILNGIRRNMENRLIELQKSLAAPFDPSICH
jgi:hypothetical protein